MSGILRGSLTLSGDPFSNERKSASRNRMTFFHRSSSDPNTTDDKPAPRSRMTIITHTTPTEMSEFQDLTPSNIMEFKPFMHNTNIHLPNLRKRATIRATRLAERRKGSGNSKMTQISILEEDEEEEEGLSKSLKDEAKEKEEEDDLTELDDENIAEELKREYAGQTTPPMISVLYGLVNAAIILPVVMSFGSIIYHDDFFRPYLAVLMKLTVVSGAVHQIMFSLCSTLPFAVGQVQDAGLIFLSAMARDMVEKLRGNGYDDEHILATITIGLSLSTAIMGAALILIGRFKLASFVQMLPTPVVGGYLAFIGFFCGQAGLALMGAVDVSSLWEWYKFFDLKVLRLVLPGIVGGISIYYAIGRIRHMAVLPCSIILLMLMFYAMLWLTGMSVEEATAAGWINKAENSPVWYHTWDFLKLDKVVWSIFPSQILTLLAMIAVVALSSSLDIAAIEIEMKRPLDYDYELKTVGISNIVSGLTGGYTGSYIFSQTIFSLRTGIKSRLMGYVIAIVMLVAMVLPFNVLAYIPNFFFGSLLTMICLDLMFEWLIDVKKKVTPAEYVVVIVTFAFIQIFGVEAGIFSGALLYLLMKKMGYEVAIEDENLDEDEMAVVNYGTI